jgi:hypothetical protein
MSEESVALRNSEGKPLVSDADHLSALGTNLRLASLKRQVLRTRRSTGLDGATVASLFQLVKGGANRAAGGAFTCPALMLGRC